MKYISLIILTILLNNCGDVLDPIEHTGRFDPSSPDYQPRAVQAFYGLYNNKNIDLLWFDESLGVTYYRISKSVDDGPYELLATIPNTDESIRNDFTDETGILGKQVAYSITSIAMGSGEAIESNSIYTIGTLNISGFGFSHELIYDSNLHVGYSFRMSFNDDYFNYYRFNFDMYDGVRFTVFDQEQPQEALKYGYLFHENSDRTLSLTIDLESYRQLSFRKELFLAAANDTLFLEF